MLLSMVITLVLLVLLEIISRVVLYHFYNRNYDALLIEENKYETTTGVKANAQGVVFGKSYTTDEMGGRKMKKKAQAKKLLILGDSVTEGVGVDDSSTFANILNEKLEAEVRNIAHIGWSVTDYEQVLTRLLGDSTISDVQLYYCLNDIYGRSKTNELPELGNKKWLSRFSHFLQERCGAYRLLKLLLLQHSDHYFQYDLQFYKDEKRVIETVNTLTRIMQICKRQQVGFCIYILPYRSQLVEQSNVLPQQTLAYHLGMSGIPFYDLLPALKTISDPQSLYLFADEIHFSVAGHRAVAEAVIGYIHQGK